MFSVVIPLYNKENSIKKTITSVLNQTFSKFEIIVIDDGSKDNGPKIVAEMATFDKRIKLFSQENKGVSIARNRGVKESVFPYIAFLDGDDEWISIYLESIYNIIKKYSNAGMICTAGLVTCNGNIYTRIANKYKNQDVIVDYFQNPHIFSHTSATVVKKEIFNMTNGFPIGMNINEDLACFFNIAMISPVVYNGRLLSIYCGNVEGQTTAIVGNSDKRIIYQTERLNYCYKKWCEYKKNNKTYLIFTKYEIRAIFYNAFKNKNTHVINYSLNNLDKNLLNEFYSFELYLYNHSTFLSKVFILFTKLIWRLHGFPVLKK